MKEKIYENLITSGIRISDSDSAMHVIQSQISATNGIHLSDRVGRLQSVPEYSLPLTHYGSGGLMLDIGAGWGRWLKAGSKQGFIPVGLDIRLEFCKTQQAYLKKEGLKGYSVVADLEEIPFVDGVFDLVWSFSVIQHTHKKRLINCLHHINRILRNAGYTVLEFPNKDGIRNRFVHRKYFDLTNDDYNSWDVRYYSIGEYKDVFNLFLRNFSFTAHSFIGIGILPEDLKYVSKKNYIPVLVSVILTRLANRFKHFSRFADSIYINASKKDESQDADISEFLKSYFSDSFDNLDILQLIRCPISGKPMVINEDRTKALVPEAGIYYPIIDSIPIIIKSEAISS